mgnify:CR=1 FL=1
MDANLEQYATKAQWHYYKAACEHGSNRKAAEALGVHPSTIDYSISRLMARAARSGYSPQHGLVEPYHDGYKAGKVTIQRDSQGTIERTWERMCEDRERWQSIVDESLEAMREGIKRENPVKPPKATVESLLNCYVITDYHLGMLSWHEETGADWDSKIAEDLLTNWFASTVKQAPDSETAILAQLGDFLHHDGLESVTPENKNILDADTRFQKIVRIAIRSLRRIVRMLLKKHQSVHLIMAEGNHDPASSVWLRESFQALYEDEPRVTVDLTPDPYYCYEHGSTSLFFHHGHRRKPTNIDDVFVAKYRDVFGRTKHSYAHMGHLHNQQSSETNLMIVEQHRTLAAPDAYASSRGFMSGRDAKCITYHKDHGEVGRITVSPDMVSE